MSRVDQRPPITPGTPCAGCQRPLRPQNVTLAKMPGTVRHRSHGRCDNCNRAPDTKTTPARPTINQMRADLRAYLRTLGFTGNDVPQENPA